jgi:hypothetical protein
VTVTTEVLEAPASCQAAQRILGAYITAGLSSRDTNRVSAHLECCRACTASYLALIDVRDDLRGPPGPQRLVVRAAAASVVVGGLLLGGLALLGSADGRPDGNPIAAPPFATESPAAHAGGTTETGLPAKPKPTSKSKSTQVAQLVTPTSAPVGTPVTAVVAVVAGPTHPPHQTPTHHPGSGGAPPTQGDPREVDMGVTATRSGPGPASVVTVTVTGLSPTQSGIVTITSDQPATTVGLDPRCDPVGAGRATCRISGAGSLQLLTGSLPLTSTTLTITATPGDGLHDSSMGDNTTRVTL